MTQDVVLQPDQFWAWRETEIVHEVSTKTLVGAQGVCVSSSTVEAPHQLRPQSLPGRIPVHEGFELTDDLRVPAQLHERIDAFLSCELPQRLEPLGGTQDRHVVGHTGEGRSLPQAEGVIQHVTGGQRPSRDAMLLPQLQEVFETRVVDVIGVNGQPIPGRDRREHREVVDRRRGQTR